MMLETSFVIDLLRGNPRALAKARELDGRGETTYLPTPVLFELWEGVARSVRVRKSRRLLEDFIKAQDLLPFAPEDAREAGFLSGKLKKQGRPMGTVDIQLAGMAKARGETLLTGDRDFSALSRLVTVEGYR